MASKTRIYFTVDINNKCFIDANTGKQLLDTALPQFEYNTETILCIQAATVNTATMVVTNAAFQSTDAFKCVGKYSLTPADAALWYSDEGSEVNLPGDWLLDGTANPLLGQLSFRITTNTQEFSDLAFSDLKMPSHVWMAIFVRPSGSLFDQSILNSKFIAVCKIDTDSGAPVSGDPEYYKASEIDAAFVNRNTLSLVTEVPLVITSSTVTKSASVHTLAPESGTIDDLTTFSNLSSTPSIFFVRLASSTDSITFKNGTGNIYTDAGEDYVLTGNGYVQCYSNGTNVYLIRAGTEFINAHITSTSNPHSVTATQVGLGNCNNTSDADKPISTLTQSALDLKQNLVSTVTAGHLAALDAQGQSYDSGLSAAAITGAMVYQRAFGTTSSDVPASGVSKGWYYLCEENNYTSTNAGYVFNLKDMAIYNGSAWDKVDASESGKVLASATDATPDYLDGKVAKSIVVTSDKLELFGDEATPTNGKFYGIESSIKGWYTPSIISAHNDLAGLQGGATNDYYHLSSTEKASFVVGPASTSENYFPQWDSATKTLKNGYSAVTAALWAAGTNATNPLVTSIVKSPVDRMSYSNALKNSEFTIWTSASVPDYWAFLRSSTASAVTGGGITLVCGADADASNRCLYYNEFNISSFMRRLGGKTVTLICDLTPTNAVTIGIEDNVLTPSVSASTSGTGRQKIAVSMAISAEPAALVFSVRMTNTGDTCVIHSLYVIDTPYDNTSATDAPAVTDDYSKGYSSGSIWVNTATDKSYICSDNSSGAAVWTEITAGAGSGEANTASNVGSQGIGIYKEKNGVDLRFYKVLGSDGVSFAINSSDYADVKLSIDGLSSTTAVNSTDTVSLFTSAGNKKITYANLTSSISAGVDLGQIMALIS